MAEIVEENFAKNVFTHKDTCPSRLEVENGRTSPLPSNQSNKNIPEHVISDFSDEEDINALMEEGNDQANSDDKQFNTLGEKLEKFFEGQEDTGLEMQERIAKVSGRA